MLPPLMAARGAGAWILSLPVLAANPGHSQEPEKAQKMNDGSGLHWISASLKWHPPSCSWKMFPDLFLGMESNTSSATLPRAGMMRSGALCLRDPLETVIVENAFLSSLGSEATNEPANSWPTPNTCPEAPNNSKNRGNGEIRARDTTQCLGEKAKLWPTPAAAQSMQGQNEADGKRGQTLVGKVRGQNWGTPRVTTNGGLPTNNTGKGSRIEDQVATWPTPTSRPDAPNKNSNQVTGFTSLTEAAQAVSWPTPAARDGKGTNNASYEERGGESKGEQLPNFVAHLWQTPGTDSFRSRGGNRKDEQGLDQQARSHEIWQTPRANEAGDYQNHRDGSQTPTLSGQSRSFAHDPTTPKPGASSSKSLPVLNPLFVEYLMNWPMNWTSAVTGSVSRGMVYTLWLPRVRSLYLRLVRSNK